MKVYLPKATTLGFAKYYAEKGDVLTYKLGGEQVYIGRAIGLAHKDGMGEVYREPGNREGRTRKQPRIACLHLGESLAHAYVIHVDRHDVTECRAPQPLGDFLSWFFTATLSTDIEAIKRSVAYGAMSDRAMREWLLPDGTLNQARASRPYGAP